MDEDKETDDQEHGADIRLLSSIGESGDSEKSQRILRILVVMRAAWVMDADWLPQWLVVTRTCRQHRNMMLRWALRFADQTVMMVTRRPPGSCRTSGSVAMGLARNQDEVCRIREQFTSAHVHWPLHSQFIIFQFLQPSTVIKTAMVRKWTMLFVVTHSRYYLV